MLNVSHRDEKDQIKSNKLWHHINFDRLFKKIKLHTDIVSSIKCDSWPFMAENWKERNRFPGSKGTSFCRPNSGGIKES